MVSYGSAKDHKGIEIERFISHRSWRKYMDALRGHTGRSRQGAGRESCRTWGTHLY